MSELEQPRYEADLFMMLGKDIFVKNRGGKKETDHFRFQCTFGVSPDDCEIIWDLLITQDFLPRGGKPYHLLWALLFMKLYCAETIHAALTGCDEKTFRKWSWEFVWALSYLQGHVVRNRHS